MSHKTTIGTLLFASLSANPGCSMRSRTELQAVVYFVSVLIGEDAFFRQTPEGPYSTVLDDMVWSQHSRGAVAITYTQASHTFAPIHDTLRDNISYWLPPDGVEAAAWHKNRNPALYDAAYSAAQKVCRLSVDRCTIARAADLHYSLVARGWKTSESLLRQVEPEYSRPYGTASLTECVSVLRALDLLDG